MTWLSVISETKTQPLGMLISFLEEKEEGCKTSVFASVSCRLAQCPWLLPRQYLHHMHCSVSSYLLGQFTDQVRKLRSKQFITQQRQLWKPEPFNCPSVFASTNEDCIPLRIQTWLPAGGVLFPQRWKQCDNLRNLAHDSLLPFVLTLEACAVMPRDRKNCGFPGVTAQQCKEKGCCFDDSIRGIPWCFQPPVIENQQEGTVICQRRRGGGVSRKTHMRLQGQSVSLVGGPWMPVT